VREDNADEGFRYVRTMFEALALDLDHQLVLNAADGADPEVAARLGEAKALAMEGYSKSGQHLERQPARQLRASAS